MKRSLILILLAVTTFSFAQESGVTMIFSPESDKFAEATKVYQTIWAAEGKKMVETMEAVSGLKFTEKEVRAIVYEGVSYSGWGDRPMRLRASYPHDVKKATLVHELGHRLIARVRKEGEVDEHRALFLILYDIWVKLYGKDFADRIVEVEKGRKGLYDYDSAWKWVLALSQEQRASRFKELLKSMT